MQKLFYFILAAVASISTPIGCYGAARSTKVARFDFMCAIEEGDTQAVGQYLEGGLDVNEKLDGSGDTLLMYAIRKLAEETEHQEAVGWSALMMLYSSAGLLGITCGVLSCEDTIKSYMQDCKDGDKFDFVKTKATLSNRWKETAAYPVVGITAAGAALFLVSSGYDHAKKIINYLYFRWRTSRSRLLIINSLINHPSIDLLMSNELKNKEGVGQTALDVVRDLRTKTHDRYIKHLLVKVERSIVEKIKKSEDEATEEVA